LAVCDLSGQLCFRSLAPGQREKNIIQGGLAQGQVVQGNLRRIEIAHDGNELVRPVSHRHNELAALRVNLEFA